MGDEVKMVKKVIRNGMVLFLIFMLIFTDVYAISKVIPPIDNF